ncbi:hypothetical protein [Flavobacterium foetidum]|uniref:hypothetical protein n=1 Tax=Flavobacterium foetidum TaxID=2026681 RepID=UPI00107573E5|nr:hypothetical protein [Flavobacterium foetidum]KAF2513874.1 hypothetical protein E0W73_13685 [Flavobacterium foetidum]
MNEIFRIKENGFDEVRKQVLIKILVIALMAMSFGLLISFFNTESTEEFFETLPIIMLFLVVSMFIGFRSAIKRYKSFFESYQLNFADKNITREQQKTPALTIQFSDIQSISQNKKGDYTIKGKTAHETIYIPSQIENNERLQSKLNQIRPVTEQNQKTFDQKYAIPLMIINLVCMAVVYISSNKILVGICAVAVSFILIRSSIIIIKNKNIDSRTKRGVYYTGLVLLSIIIVAIMKIAAF